MHERTAANIYADLDSSQKQRSQSTHTWPCRFPEYLFATKILFWQIHTATNLELTLDWLPSKSYRLQSLKTFYTRDRTSGASAKRQNAIAQYWASEDSQVRLVWYTLAHCYLTETMLCHNNPILHLCNKKSCLLKFPRPHTSSATVHFCSLTIPKYICTYEHLLAFTALIHFRRCVCALSSLSKIPKTMGIWLPTRSLDDLLTQKRGQGGGTLHREN